MELRVLCSGVPIGTFEVTACAGLAHAILSPGGSFEMARPDAELAGAALSIRHSAWRYWPSARGDFADAFAAALAGGYELSDTRGLPVGAASVALIAKANDTIVVADFRPDCARVVARLAVSPTGGNDRRRPAA